MPREIKNYSTISLPRTFNNTHRLALNGFRFQPDSSDHTGQYLKISDQNGEIIGELTGESTSQIITVHPQFPNSGNKRNTISEAITYASSLSPSSNNRILIDVLPGFYVETVQLTPPDWVYIEGRNTNGCYIQLQSALAANQGFINMTNDNTGIRSLTFDALTNAEYCFHSNGLTQLVTEFCSFLGGTISVVQLDTLNSISFFVRCLMLITNASCVQCVNITNSAQFASIGNIIADGFNNKTKIGMNYSNSSTPASGFRNQPSNQSVQNFDICCKLDGSSLFNTGGDFFNSNTGILLINNSIATLNVMNLNCTINFNVDSTSSIFTNGILVNDIKNTIINNTENVSIDYFEEQLDNQLGRHFLGNLTIGNKDIPGVSYFGQGAFDFSGITYLKFNGSIYIDVSNNLRPSSATKTTLFDDLTLGIFYIGDDEKFYALEYDVDTILDGIILFEYWDGISWTAFNNQTTQSEIPYGSYEDLAFSAIEEQDSRFDIRLSGATFNWSQTTINGITKFWVRLCISGTLITSPILNFLRLIYSSTKIDKNGTSLRFGNSRAYKSIVFDLNTLRAPGNASIKPLNQDLYLGENSRLGREQNSVRQSDILGFSFFAPNDLDSSSPFKVYLAYVSSSTNATQPDFEVDVTLGNLHIGDKVYFTQASAIGNPIRDESQSTHLLPVNQTDGTFASIKEFQASVPFIKSRNTNGQLEELFHIDIERAVDSNANNLVFIQISVLYLSFSDGITFIG